MEQVIDWLNENERRAYPLMTYADKAIGLEDLSNLPENFLLDLQISTEEELGSAPILLQNIDRSTEDDSVTVIFGTALTTLAVFKVYPLTVTEYPLYLRTPDGNLAVFGEGLLEFFNASIATTSLSLAIPVEPATCTQFNGAWFGVNSISTAPEKKSKTTAVKLDNRHHPILPLENEPTADTTHMEGNIQFLSGYNTRVGISENLIDLEIGVGYGLIMSCTTEFIEEIYRDCSSLISYINGVPPDASGNFRLLSGSNINITAGTDISSFNDPYAEQANQHSLFVGLTFQSTDLCAPINLTPST
jgi:hypothetical protein